MSDNNPASYLSIDLSKIKDTPLTDGPYAVEIVGAALGTTGNGKPKIDIKHKIIEGPEEGRYVWDLITIDEDPSSFSMRRLKSLLLLIGYKSTEGDQRIDLEQFKGEVVTVWVKTQAQTKIDPATGEPYPPRTNVQRYEAYGSAPQINNFLSQPEEDD